MNLRTMSKVVTEANKQEIDIGEIITIKYLGEEHTAPRHKLITLLRFTYALSFREIGDLIGVSRGTVSTELGELDDAEDAVISTELFDKFTSAQLALHFNKPLSEVQLMATRNERAKEGYIKLQSRRTGLAKYLFGNAYRDGPNFVDWLKEICPEVGTKTKDMADDLIAFYISGYTSSEYRRIERNRAKKELASLLVIKKIGVNSLTASDVLKEVV